MLAAGGPRGAVAGVLVDGERVAADAVVLAMGPWTALARAWLTAPSDRRAQGVQHHPSPRLRGSGRDAVLRVPHREGGGPVARDLPAPGRRGVGVLGCRTTSRCRSIRRTSRVDDARCDELRRIAGTLATGLGKAEITRPPGLLPPDLRRRDALPRAGAGRAVPASTSRPGTTAGGILNAPASGKAMAELVALGEARTVDLAPFDPARLLEAA